MFKSATIKLTFSYLAILMFLSVAFSMFIYNISINSLQNQFDEYFYLTNAGGVNGPPAGLDNVPNTQLDEMNQNLRSSINQK
jgi:hypothetical protein